MMKLNRSWWGISLCSLVLFWGYPTRCSAQEPIDGDYWAHDPSTMIKDGNRYFIYRTSDGILAKWSTDKVNWNDGGKVFPSGPPAWTTNAVPAFQGTFWAPDIAFFNGAYHLYYSVSEWGTIDSAIGLVTSPSLQSPTWTDQGKVIQSDAVWEAGPDTDLTSFNCIDPSLLVETNGEVWMSFGSYSDGILVMPLNPATGKRLHSSVAPTKIADNGSSFFSNTTEGSCLHRRGNLYYLFLNFGGCCAGTNSTYNIRVGRSTSVTGPYRDRNGVSMLNGGGTMLLQSSGRFIGPGHAGIMSEEGIDWFTYHYYDGQDNGVAKLGLARLQWTEDDWPYLVQDHSALSAFYTFEANADEHLGLYDGQLAGGATVRPEANRGKVVQLNGSTGYVELPASVANGSTFAAWVKWNGGGTWQRIFDFGDGTSRYLFLSPRANSGKMRFAITANGNGNEQIIEGSTALPTNSWTHVAVTVEPGRGLLYLNGQPVGTNTSMTLQPWEVLARSNYLGKSQWPDPLFNGRIDSFRVFGRALGSAEIRDLAFAQPSLAHRYSFNRDISDSIGNAHGTLHGNAGVTNGHLVLPGTVGDYVELPGGLVSGCSAVTVEFWASFGANGSMAPVFEFGNVDNQQLPYNYLSFTPDTGFGAHRFAISTTNGTRNHDVLSTLNEQTLHIVCIADPSVGYTALYTNGVLESEETGSLPALSEVGGALAFLGRPLLSSDAWLNATIDEFRIYDGGLEPEDIAADFRAGPDALAIPVRLSATVTSSSSTFTWPDYAVGFEVESASLVGATANWLPVFGTPALQNGAYRLTVPHSDPTGFFRSIR